MFKVIGAWTGGAASAIYAGGPFYQSSEHFFIFVVFTVIGIVVGTGFDLILESIKR